MAKIRSSNRSVEATLAMNGGSGTRLEHGFAISIAPHRRSSGVGAIVSDRLVVRCGTPPRSSQISAVGDPSTISGVSIAVSPNVTSSPRGRMRGTSFHLA